MIPNVIMQSLFDFEVFGNELFFLIIVIASITVIGIMARSLALGSMGGFLMFVHLAVGTDNSVLVTLLITLLVGVIVVMALRFWSFGSGESMDGGGV